MKRVLITYLLLQNTIFCQQWGSFYQQNTYGPTPLQGNPFGNMYYSPYTPQSASPYYNPISNPSGAIPVTIQNNDNYNAYSPAAYGQQVYENLTSQSRMMAETMMEARRQRNIEEQQQMNYALQQRQQALAERQAALQEELTRKQIQELERQSALNRQLEAKNAAIEKQLSGYKSDPHDSRQPFMAQEKPLRVSANYDGKNEVPPSLNYYKTEILTIVSSAKKEIDQLIVKGDILAAKQYRISKGVENIFQDEMLRIDAMSFINAEVEKFKITALKPFSE